MGNTAHAEYNGQAPNAKLAFWDIGNAQGRLNLPQPYNVNLLPWQYAAGARIHSNSWGAALPYYDSSASEFDRMMWDNKDLLVLIAVGNSGTQGEGSVGTPATSKNSIGVGASSTSQRGFADAGVQQQNRFTTEGFENSVAYFSSIGPVNPSKLTNFFRGDERLSPTLMAPGASIISAKVGQQPSDTCKGAPSATLKSMAGTSMATPSLAGSMALVREYFEEGYWPSGTRGGSPPLTPSSALMRAVAVGGATVLTGVHGKTPLDVETPNVYQGYGRANMDNSLYFIGDQSRLLIMRSDEPRKMMGDPAIGY